MQGGGDPLGVGRGLSPTPHDPLAEGPRVLAPEEVVVDHVARPPIREAAERPPGPPTPVVATPPLPPIFPADLQTAQLSDGLSKTTVAAKGFVARLPLDAPAAEEDKVQEDYALCEFHRNVNDAFRIHGFDPIFEENKVVVDGKDVVFLGDRVIIPGVSEGEAPALIKKMKDEARAPAQTKYTKEQVDLIQKLSIGTVKPLETGRINDARKAAEDAADRYLKNLGNALSPTGTGMYQTPMSYVKQQRVAGVAGYTLRPGYTPGPNKDQWQQQFLDGMQAESGTFRNLVRIATRDLAIASGTLGTPPPADRRSPGPRAHQAAGVASAHQSDDSLISELATNVFRSGLSPKQIQENLDYWIRKANKTPPQGGTQLYVILQACLKIQLYFTAQDRGVPQTISDCAAGATEALKYIKWRIPSFPQRITLAHLQLPPPDVGHAAPVSAVPPSVNAVAQQLTESLNKDFRDFAHNPSELQDALKEWLSKADAVDVPVESLFHTIRDSVGKILDYFSMQKSLRAKDIEVPTDFVEKALDFLHTYVPGFPPEFSLANLKLPPSVITPLSGAEGLGARVEQGAAGLRHTRGRSGSSSPAPLSFARQTFRGGSVRRAEAPETEAQKAEKRAFTELNYYLSGTALRGAYQPPLDTLTDGLTKWVAAVEETHPADESQLGICLPRVKSLLTYFSAFKSEGKAPPEVTTQAMLAFDALSLANITPEGITLDSLHTAAGLPPRPLARGRWDAEEEAGAAAVESAAQVVTAEERHVMSLIATDVFKAGAPAEQIRANVKEWIKQAQGLTHKKGSQLYATYQQFVIIAHFFDAQDSHNESLVTDLTPSVINFLDEFKESEPGFPQDITIDNLKLSETLEDLPSEDVSMPMAVRSHFQGMDTDEAAAVTAPLAEGARLTARESTQMLGRLKDILSGTSSDDNEKKLQRWLKEMEERPPTADTPLAECMEPVRTILTCLTVTNRHKRTLAQTGKTLGSISSDETTPAEAALRRLKVINRDIPENVTLYSIIDLPKPMDRAFDSFDSPSLEAARTMPGARGTIRSTVRAGMRAESPPPLSVDLSESSVIDDDPEEDTPPAIQELDPLLAPAEELLPPLPEKAAPLPPPVVALNPIFSADKKPNEILQALTKWKSRVSPEMAPPGSPLATCVENVDAIVAYIIKQQEGWGEWKRWTQGFKDGFLLNLVRYMQSARTALEDLKKQEGFPSDFSIENLKIPELGTMEEGILQ